ncbi:MAG TPA: ABC transporter permease [Actinomycetota bacterium]|nr:ABC transporter permease [Actinomycetota bacterium]
MRRGTALVFGALTCVALVFVALPLVALVVKTSPGALIRSLGDPAARNAALVSLKTSVIAHALILLVGTPAAYVVATRKFPGRAVAVAVMELPLVLPPAVAGIALLATFGRLGLLGHVLTVLNVDISFTQTAVVLAVAFVAFPFYVRQAVAAFESVDARFADAARTLGASPWRTFRRIALPLARPGLAAGSALAFARGLGEFGATIMFAGSFPGRTQTLPLAIYAQLDRNLDVAIAIGVVLIAISIVALIGVRLSTTWSSNSRSLVRSAT